MISNTLEEIFFLTKRAIKWNMSKVEYKLLFHFNFHDITYLQNIKIRKKIITIMSIDIIIKDEMVIQRCSN